VGDGNIIKFGIASMN